MKTTVIQSVGHKLYQLLGEYCVILNGDGAFTQDRLPFGAVLHSSDEPGKLLQ